MTLACRLIRVHTLPLCSLRTSHSPHQVRPFRYANGNILSVIGYGSILTSYLAAAFRKVRHSGSYSTTTPSNAVDNIVFFIWILPYLATALDALRVGDRLKRMLPMVTGCCRRLGCAQLHAPLHVQRVLRENRQRAQQMKTNMKHRNGRAGYVIDILTAQLELGQVAHTKAARAGIDGSSGSGRGGDSKDRLGTAHGSFVGGDNDGDKDTIDTAHGNFVAAVEDMVRATSAENVLCWKHCREVEETAKCLSRLAYPVATEEKMGERQSTRSSESKLSSTDMVVVTSIDKDEDHVEASTPAKQTRLKSGHNLRSSTCRSAAGGSRKDVHLGRVRLAFAWRSDGLWEASVSDQLRRFEGGDIGKRPDMAHLEVWRHAVVSLLLPGSDFGWFDFQGLVAVEQKRLARQRASGQDKERTITTRHREWRKRWITPRQK